MIVLIIDSNPLYLRALAIFMTKKNDDVRILTESSQESATLLIARSKPEVIIITANMSPVNGYDFIKRTLRFWPQAKFIGLSMFFAQPIREQLLNCGAKGYLTRGCDPEYMMNVIRKVAEGAIIFPKSDFEQSLDWLNITNP